MDKTKIFDALKREYARLGLGDSLLQALADSLANSGFVTDENLESVIAGQKAYLEGLQKSNDKRVTEAIEKAKKAAEEAQAAKIAELQKLLEEAKKDKNTPPTPPPSDEDKFKKWYESVQQEREEKEKNFQQQIDELKKAKEEADKAKADAEKARAQQERLTAINEKAKAKGIPDWIIKRGFGTLPADADDAAVDAYLSEYAQELKTNFLPGKGSIPQGEGGKADKSETDAMVNKLFPKPKQEK